MRTFWYKSYLSKKTKKYTEKIKTEQIKIIKIIILII